MALIDQNALLATYDAMHKGIPGGAQKGQGQRKVYVITKGEYSSYSICTVTMDKNRAENLKRLLDGDHNDACIEEYILDECKDGDTSYYVDFFDDAPPKININFEMEYVTRKRSAYVYNRYGLVRIYVCAKDEQHALKIAQDEYAKWKAKKEGVA